jgi:surface antigen/Tol biopolymer transport system component
VLAVAVGLAGSFAPPAAAGDDYPWKGNGYDMGQLSPLRFNYRNCTDFVAFRLNQQLGGSTSKPKFWWSTLFSVAGRGHAIYWKDAVIHKYGAGRVNTTPAVGAVAWWGSERGSLGHVAMVSKVNGDGSVNIEQYNVVAGAYSTQNNVRATAYLHIADLPRRSPDINGDGSVGWRDLNILLSTYGGRRDMRADLDGDGSVTIFDLSILLSAWGKTYPRVAGIATAGPAFSAVEALQEGARAGPSAATASGPTAFPAARVSTTGGGSDGDGASFEPAVSDDGRFVAFSSDAANLVPGDTNDKADIFVFDRETGARERISMSHNGQQTDGPSGHPRISADGSVVVFDSAATNVTPVDENGVSDVFVHFRANGNTFKVSTPHPDTWDGHTLGPDGGSWAVDLSADGRFIVFESYATNLVVGDTNGVLDVFVRQLSGYAERISVSSGEGEGAGDSFDGSISGDGRYVAFGSLAANLVGGDGNETADAFVRDRHAGTTSRVSLAGSGAEGNGTVNSTVISRDGRYVAFDSDATNLVGGDTNGVRDVFVRDRNTGATTRESVDDSGAEANGRSLEPSLSGDGRIVAFRSEASNLASDDANGVDDPYVRDRQTGTTERIGRAVEDEDPNASSASPALGGPGRFVVFASAAGNLAPDDANGVQDVFVVDRAPPPPALPRNTEPPTIEGLAQQGEVLRLSVGTWTDFASPPTFSRQWLRCDESGGACEEIGHGTLWLYVPVRSDVGSTIRVRVSVTTTAGTTTVTSDPTEEVTAAVVPFGGGIPYTTFGTTDSTGVGFGNVANRLLLFMAFQDGDDPLTSVTYAGLPLTRLAEAAHGSARVEVWYLARPPIGFADLVWQKGGPSRNVVWGFAGYHGVDQVAPFGEPATSGGTHVAPAWSSVSVPTTDEQLVFDAFVATGEAGHPIADLTQTWHWRHHLPPTQAGFSDKPAAAGSTTMAWTPFGSQPGDWATIAVPLNPTPGTPTPNVSSLADGFNDDEAGSDWNDRGESSGSVDDDEGQVEIALPGLAAKGARRTVDAYDATGGAAHIRLTRPDFVRAWFELGSEMTDRVGLQVDETGQVSAYKFVGGTTTQLGATPFDAASKDWWRIRESGGTTYWEIAAEATGPWTLLASAPNPIAMDNVQVAFGGHNRTSSARAVAFDDFNTFSPVSLTAPSIDGPQPALPGLNILQAAPGDWAGDELTFTYQWETCLANDADDVCSDIAGATGPTYALEPGFVWHDVAVTVHAADAQGHATTARSARFHVDPPTQNASPPTVTGDPVQGGELTGHVGRWVGVMHDVTDDADLELRWQRCDGADACADIAGAVRRLSWSMGEVESTYEPAAADVTRRLRVVVTPIVNGARSSISAASALSAVIAPDVTPPDTSISTGAAGTVASSRLTFEFASEDDGATFECRLDSPTWSACGSPATVGPLPPGAYVFEVRARDAAANADASPAGRALRVVRPFVFGSGQVTQSEPAVWRPATGGWFRAGQPAVFFGWQGDVPLPGQWDADDAVDLAVWRPTSGGWYTPGQSPGFFGAATDVPVPADWNDDGIDDRGVWRPSSGGWYRPGLPVSFYGVKGDVPLPGQWDADPEVDLAVYRPSNGGWFRQGQPTVFFGTAADVPVPADWNGDGVLEPGVWRPATGGWHRLGLPTVYFGRAGDVPVPGSWNADDGPDIAVWRPASGGWYRLGLPTVYLGAQGDIP